MICTKCHTEFELNEITRKTGFKERLDNENFLDQFDYAICPKCGEYILLNGDTLAPISQLNFQSYCRIKKGKHE